jgi:hypothetical protein
LQVTDGSQFGVTFEDPYVVESSSSRCAFGVVVQSTLIDISPYLNFPASTIVDISSQPEAEVETSLSSTAQPPAKWLIEVDMVYSSEEDLDILLEFKPLLFPSPLGGEVNIEPPVENMEVTCPANVGDTGNGGGGDGGGEDEETEILPNPLNNQFPYKFNYSQEVLHFTFETQVFGMNLTHFNLIFDDDGGEDSWVEGKDYWFELKADQEGYDIEIHFYTVHNEFLKNLKIASIFVTSSSITYEIFQKISIERKSIYPFLKKNLMG